MTLLTAAWEWFLSLFRKPKRWIVGRRVVSRG